jgi:hypothetical protein
LVQVELHQPVVPPGVVMDKIQYFQLLLLLVVVAVVHTSQGKLALLVVQAVDLVVRLLEELVSLDKGLRAA